MVLASSLRGALLASSLRAALVASSAVLACGAVGCASSARETVPVEEVVIARANGGLTPAAPAKKRLELGVIDLRVDRWAFGDPTFRLDPPPIDALVADGLPADLRVAWRRLRGEHEQELSRRLDVAIARAGDHAPAALLVAAAHLHESHAGVERAAELYDHAIDASPTTEALTWFARVGAARTREALGDAERAMHIRDSALDAATLTTPVWALWAMARQVQGPSTAPTVAMAATASTAATAGAPATPGVETGTLTEQWILAHRKAAAAAAAGPLGRELRARWISASYNAGDWKECLGAAVDTVARSADEEERTFAANAAAICLQHMGGWEQTPMGTISGATYATVLAAVAERAETVRHDRPAARRAWEAILDRAPNTLEAPIAVARLASGAVRAGDRGKARALREQGLRQYAFSSPWAAMLRASRGESGYPSPESMLRGVQALLVFDDAVASTSEEDLAAESRHRLEEAGRYCMAHPSALQEVYGEISVDIKVLAFPDRTAVVNGVPLGRPDELSAARRCLQNEGPEFFEGAPMSVHAVVRVAP